MRIEISNNSNSLIYAFGSIMRVIMDHVVYICTTCRCLFEVRLVENIAVIVSMGDSDTRKDPIGSVFRIEDHLVRYWLTPWKSLFWFIYGIYRGKERRIEFY